MRRATLELLRCPRCGGGSLVPVAAVAPPALEFGPVQCLGCGALYPVGEGMVDLEGDLRHSAGLQRTFELSLVARAYERSLRPALGALATLGRFDLESEYLLYRALLGRPSGPLLDLGCGTGVLARRLAREPEHPQVIGLDVSKPMIEEAIAQAREHGAPVDFVRAHVPPLPLRDAVLGGVLLAGSLHFIPDLDALVREVARVLQPRGRLVASTWLTPLGLAPLQRLAGLHPRSEAVLAQACAAAGLVRFERVRMAPVLVFKAERP